VADVHLAQGGEEGIALLSELPHIDVVFCDLLMPRTSGIEVHAWIKANRPELLERFVVLTAGASEERYRMFLESADLKVITKPFSVHEVSELIQGYARSGRAARA
jgi:CheY-like chemotaxis protein